MKIYNNKDQTGAVSLFLVVFATLLITIVTVSFTRIMVQYQQEANAIDLSQSAYDSAQAGIEDAKRALKIMQDICIEKGASSPECLSAKAKISSTTCNDAINVIDPGSVIPSEVKIKTSNGDLKLDQSYTCLKIALETPSFIGELLKDDSNVIPLVGTSSFQSVKIEWFSEKDLSPSAGGNVQLSGGVGLGYRGEGPFTSVANWDEDKPPILRTQLIQFGGNGFTLSDFDNWAGGSLNSGSLFFYPVGNSGIPYSLITGPYGSDSWVIRNMDYVKSDHSGNKGDSRRSGAIEEIDTPCSGLVSSGGYSCGVILNLPSPINGGDRNAYLRLAPFYNNAQYKVTLYSGNSGTGSIVNFDGVQPEVDSTGRANDLFRRVRARVEMVDNNFPYPEAAIDTSGNLCKDFSITDTESDYNSGSCTP